MSYAHFAPTRDGALTLSVAPTAEPLTTAEAKTHLRVDHSTDDTYIDTLIAAARRACERITRRAFLNQTWTITWPSFDYATDGSGRIIKLPKPKLQSVTSIVYRDDDNASQTFDSAKYTVVTPGQEYGFIELNDTESWPTTYSRADAVVVTFVAGYGAAATAVPGDILHAMKLLIGHWYENRESINVGNIVTEVPQAVEFLLETERVFEFI